MDKLFIVLLVLVVLCIIPAAVIWSLNTLFPVADIPHNFFTYLAVYGLVLVFNSGSATSK